MKFAVAAYSDLALGPVGADAARPVSRCVPAVDELAPAACSLRSSASGGVRSPIQRPMIASRGSPRSAAADAFASTTRAASSTTSIASSAASNSARSAVREVSSVIPASLPWMSERTPARDPS